MLTGITLENFKAFKEEQFIPINRITLVFGPNSAGKSSIIHALAFLKHVHQTDGDCNPGQMNYGWSNLDLGSWESLVFGQDKSATMKIKLHTETTAIQWCFKESKVASFEIKEKVGDDWITTAEGKNVGRKGILWEVLLHPRHWLWNEYKATLWKKLTERSFERTSAIHEPANAATQEESFSDEITDDGESSKFSAHDLSSLRYNEFEKHFNQWLGESGKTPPLGCRPHDPDECDIPFEGLFPRQALPGGFFNQAKKLKKNDNTYYNSGCFDKNFTDDVFDGLLKGLSDGSLTVQESENFFGDLHVGGELRRINNALHLDDLLSSFVTHLHLDAQRFPPEGILSKKRLSSEKSEHQPWLRLLDDFKHHFYSDFRNQLNFYRLKCSIPDDIADEIQSAHETHKIIEKWPSLSQKLAGVDVPDFVIDHLFKYGSSIVDLPPIWGTNDGLDQIRIQYKLNTRKHLTRVYTPDVDTGGEAEASNYKTSDTWDTELVFIGKSGVHTIHNLGSGVRVIVPVIVALVTAEAELLSIEEPECHVHPKLQAELGDLLIQRVGWTFCANPNMEDPIYSDHIDGWDSVWDHIKHRDKRNRQSSNTLVETHSEHLILRILRRIRETTEGEMIYWPPALRTACPNGIKPEDVSVLYVQPGENGSEVIELPVDANGEFTCDWPEGFFEDRLKELGI
jgi:predicted ATPase